MIFWCLSLSFSAPYYLGPDGISYVGLGPNHHPRQEEIVIVDPQKGSLWIEGAHGRIWNGDHWEGADPQNPNHRFVQSRLTAVIEGTKKHLYFYDEDDRIVMIRWSNGESFRIRYHNDGRVARLEGGPGSLWNLTWGRALIVQQEGSPSVRISSRQKDDGYSITATESTGRTVESGYTNDVLQYWVDPAGVRTNLDWKPNHLKIRKSNGKIWNVGFDSDYNWTSLIQPDLSAWVWKRNDSGALLSQIDPLGRSINLETDDEGMIRTSSSSGTTLSYHRDAMGRLTKVDDVMGLRLRLGWDAEDRINSIRDATDGNVQISYDRNGNIYQLTDRGGGRWFLERDGDGLLTQIITPEKDVWSFSRNRSGHPVQVQSPFSVLDIARDYQGLPTVLRLNQKEEISFVRDLMGNISSVRYLDQTVQRWEWNNVREPIKFWSPADSILFERNSGGWITSWSGFTCTRDGLGRILSIEEEGKKFKFIRDAIGKIRTIQKDSYEIDIAYNGHDLPVRWKESNGASSDVVRNERGQITKGDDVEISYDVKGWISKAQLNERTWRWSRDIAGRVLQLIAPGGSKVGFDRTAYGLIKFIRYPDSTILRFFRSIDQLEIRLIASDSTLLDQVWYLWNQYGLVVEKKKGDTRTFFRRDPKLDIVAVERADGLIWSKTLDGVRDGLNGKAIFSFDGRVVGVQPPVGSYPYGKELGYLAYHRDEVGKITELIDAADQAVFSYDGLDRLRTICFRRQGCWKFFYDPRGMLSGFVLPGETKQKLYWRPDMSVGEFHRPVLLGAGDNSWLQGPHGLIVSEDEDHVVGFVFDPMGGVRWVLNEEREQPFSSLSMTYMGEVAPLFGQSDALHLGAAGPVFRGDIAYEPFSDQRYDGVQVQEHLYEEGVHRLPSLRYDEPRSFWRDPLRLLQDLSLLPKMEKRISISSTESLVQWLPKEYTERSRVGIHGLDLFVDGKNDELVDLYLELVFTGKPDPSSEDILRHILRKEFAEDWMWGRLLNHVIWWNSDTKLDPRLANVLFLE